jgi:hypothetical protein
LRNEGGEHRAVRLVLRGVTSNRSAIGARATVRLSDGTARWQMVKTGSSYLSQSELPLTFGLGASATVTAVEITWPDGRVERLPAVPSGQTAFVEEGRGIVKSTPFRAGGARTSAALPAEAGSHELTSDR